MTAVKMKRYDGKEVYINPDSVCQVMELQSGYTKVTMACGEIVTDEGIEAVLAKLKFGVDYHNGLI